MENGGKCIMRNIQEENFLKMAVILARMYGIAETLEPLPYRSHDEFFTMVCAWTEEFLKKADITDFFEAKLAEPGVRVEEDMMEP